MPSTRRIHTHTALRSGLLLAAFYSLPLSAETISDLLIVLDTDGRHYTAQHTLSSEGDLITQPLPAQRQLLQTQFSGPERTTFTQAFQHHPNQLSLWSGGVVTRYQHRYGAGLVKPTATRYRLDVSAEHRAASVEDPAALRTTITWLLPANATLLAYENLDKAVNRDDSRADSHWQTHGNSLTYTQSSGTMQPLQIEYELEAPLGEETVVCDRYMRRTDHCSSDIDGDEIPDYRDICLPTPSDVLNTSVPQRDGSAESIAHSDSASFDAIGCNHQSVIVLHGVSFQSGQSYLDVTTRQVLDRVAYALQAVPEQLFEVASHTDNAGRLAHNQRLSENRADAVRHYLMLRGVGPNQLQARGYGETSPQRDNTLESGQRANRRVELRRLN